MNKQKAPKGIEWTRIRITHEDGRENTLTGYTWNPTGGCLHGCTWKMPDGSVTECYAKTIAERFTSAYTQGWEHHYWRPEALNQPLKLKTPSGIFVGSMADLFGHWVDADQIRQVLDVMTKADWHIFQTLSKYPLRLPEFNPFPENVWVGVSVPAGRLMNPKGAANALYSYLKYMENIEANIRFMSIEPLWFDVVPVFEKWLQANDTLPFEWVIIGAASDGRKLYQPKTEWTQELLDLLDVRGIPVFFKGNMDWSNDDWRNEFPTSKTEMLQPV